MNFKKNVNIAEFPYSLIYEVKPHSKHIHMVWHASFVCIRLWSSFQTEAKELNFAFSWFYTLIFFFFFGKQLHFLLLYQLAYVTSNFSLKVAYQFLTKITFSLWLLIFDKFMLSSSALSSFAFGSWTVAYI